MNENNVKNNISEGVIKVSRLIIGDIKDSSAVKLEYGEMRSGETVFVSVSEINLMDDVIYETESVTIGFYQDDKSFPIIPVVCIKTGFIEPFNLSDESIDLILKNFHVTSIDAFMRILYAVCYANGITYWSDDESDDTPYSLMRREEPKGTK